MDAVIISSYTALVIVLAIGLWVFVGRRSHPANRYFFYFTVAQSVWNLGIVQLMTAVRDEAVGVAWSKVLFAGAIFTPVFFTRLTSALIEKEWPEKPHRILYGLTWIFLLLAPFPIFSPGVSWFETAHYIAQAGIGLALFVLFYSTMMVVNLVRLYRAARRSPPPRQTQLRYVFLASLFYVLGIFTVYPMLFRVPFIGTFPWWNFTTTIFGITLAGVITKTRLMDVTVMISRSVAYGLDIAVLSLGYLGLVGILRANGIASTGFPYLVATLLFWIIAALVFQPLRLFLQTTADKLILRGRYDYYDEIRKRTERLTQRLEVTDILRELYETFRDVVEVSAPSVFVQGRFFGNQESADMTEHPIRAEGPPGYIRWDQARFQPMPGGPAFPLGDPLVSTMRLERRPIKATEWGNSPGADLLRRLKAEWVFPCLLEDRLIGFFALGPKLSEDPYSTQDINLIQALANQAAVALDHTRSYEAIRQELRAEQEKVQLASIQLERAARLSSLGTVVAEIAHEIRNPLSVLQMRAAMLPDNLDDRKFVDETCILIKNSVQDVLDVSQRMLDTASGKKVAFQKIHLNDLIEAALAAETGNGGQVAVRRELEDLPDVTGDEIGLLSVFKNIIHNARRAMEGQAQKGITLRTKLTHVADAPFLRIEISDTGPGIAPENAARIFDPFFTTWKEGAGLGLSLCHRIVESHGGTIYAQSRPGEGATFTILIPVNPESQRVAQKPAASSPE